MKPYPAPPRYTPFPSCPSISELPSFHLPKEKQLDPERPLLAAKLKRETKLEKLRRENTKVKARKLLMRSRLPSEIVRLICAGIPVVVGGIGSSTLLLSIIWEGLREDRTWDNYPKNFNFRDPSVTLLSMLKSLTRLLVLFIY